MRSRYSFSVIDWVLIPIGACIAGGLIAVAIFIATVVVHHG